MERVTTTLAQRQLGDRRAEVMAENVRRNVEAAIDDLFAAAQRAREAFSCTEAVLRVPPVDADPDDVVGLADRMTRALRQELWAVIGQLRADWLVVRRYTGLPAEEVRR